MKDSVWKRSKIASPCVKLCVIHPDAGICIGCHRTLAEIARWSAMPEAERQQVMAALPARGQRLRQRRGGRAARTRES